MVARRRGLRSAALLAALLALGSVRIGYADDPRGEARAHYAKGLELASQNGYEGALREFNTAYAISPQFAVLFNIGQAHIALGHTVEFHRGRVGGATPRVRVDDSSVRAGHHRHPGE